VHSRRVLGAVALGALVVAAVSFAVVDVATRDAMPCSGACAPLPVVAVTFGALGGMALLVAVLPAVAWVVESIRATWHASDEADVETARAARARRVLADDDEL
jgi:hypothetical protein